MAAAAPSNPYYTKPGQFWDLPPQQDLGLTDPGQFVAALTELSKPKNQIAPVDYGMVNRLAGRSASSDIAAGILAYHQEQARLLRNAQSQSKLIYQGGAAAANATTPLAGEIQNAYRTAAADQAGFAQGASGDLRTAMENDNSKLAAQLAAIGSPQHPDATQPGALATVTQTLGGTLPSGVLANQAANAYTAGLAIPAAFRGYAQQTGIGVLGAAQQEADKYNLDISKLQATRGKLTQDYASQFATQAQAAQKFALDMRNQQIDMIGKFATLAQSSNATKIALAKLDQSRITTHNGIVKAMNTYNLSVGKALEAQRHNYITEGQANQRIQNAQDALTQQWNIHQDNWNTANRNANATAMQAQTSRERAQGWYFNTDSKGHPVGLPQPTENHKIVWPSGVPGKGPWRSVRVTSGGSGSAAAKSRASAVKDVSSAMDDLINGKMPPSKTNRQGQEVIPGWNMETNTLDNAQLFLSNGGVAPLGYNDLIRKLYHVSGNRLTPKQIAKMVDPAFGDAHIAAAFNLTAGESKDPSVVSQYALGAPTTGLRTTGMAGPPTTTSEQPTAAKQGAVWNPRTDQVVTMGSPGNTAVTRSGKLVDVKTRRYITDASQATPTAPAIGSFLGSGSVGSSNDWQQSWQQSGYVRPAYDWLRSIVQSSNPSTGSTQADPVIGPGPPGTGLHMTQSGRYVDNYGNYVKYP